MSRRFRAEALPGQLTIAFEKVLLAEMERERSLLGDESLDRTVARRILVGAELVGDGLVDHLDWRPVSTRAEELSLSFDADTLDTLETICLSTNYPADVVIEVAPVLRTVWRLG